MRNITFVFFIFFVTLNIAVAQDSVEVSLEKALVSVNNTSVDSVSIQFRTQFLRQPLTAQLFGPDQFGVTLKQTFKYDTTWDNPETRCYELKKTLTPKYMFLFKLTSKQQYLPF